MTMATTGLSSEPVKPDRWRRSGLASQLGKASFASGLPGASSGMPGAVAGPVSRLEAVTVNLAAASLADHSDPGVAMPPPAGVVTTEDDTLAPLPSEGRPTNAERRKADLKNRKTSTAVAAAAAGLKTLPEVAILPKHGSSFSLESSVTIDWNTPIAFLDKRHIQKIEGSTAMSDSLRVRDRMVKMKTVSVALVLCLNVGVDPPDVVKPNPCARSPSSIGYQEDWKGLLKDAFWLKIFLNHSCFFAIKIKELKLLRIIMHLKHRNLTCNMLLPSCPCNLFGFIHSWLSH